MSRAHRRGPWVAEEDATLLSLVAARGPNNWVQISQHMHYRSPKQCRERYHQNLKGSLNHEPISAHEGEQIEQMVSAMGKKWAEIARRLGNRSDNAVKNWWNGSQNRRKRNVSSQGPASKTLVNRSQPLSAMRTSRSPVQRGLRHHGYGDSSSQCHQSWHDPGSAHSSPRMFQAHHNRNAEQGRHHERSHSQLYDVHRSQDSTYLLGRALGHPSPLDLRRSGVDGHISQLLPSLGAINTRQPPSLFTSRTNQAPLSANSMDAAPSLVSDHNSAYSISPRTWPSPPPDIPVLSDSKINRWDEPQDGSRRGSAPAISNLISSPFAGDEGYVSAIPPSASSEQRHQLPTPIGRPASFDGHFSHKKNHDDDDNHYHNNSNHRYCASNPNIRLSPLIERSSGATGRSGTRDDRMNFSSLLN